MTEMTIRRPVKSNIALALLILALAFGGILGSALTASADPGPTEPPDWIEVAARTIGVDTETIFTEWDDGKSLAEVAQAHNADPQQMIDAIVAAEKAWVDQMVVSDEFEFTQAEAGEWLQDLNQDAVFFIMVGDEVDWEAIAAKTIGVDVDALFTAMMEENRSIAEVAQANGIDPQQVIDAIVTAEKAWLNQMVADGVFSQQEADELLATEETFRADVRAFVEGKDQFIFDGEEGFFDGVDWDEVAAKAIDIDSDTLYAGWDEGESLAEVAQAHNVDPQQVIDAIVAAEKAWVNQMVADGVISQTDADTWLVDLEAVVRSFIEETGDDFVIMPCDGE